MCLSFVEAKPILSMCCKLCTACVQTAYVANVRLRRITCTHS